MFGKGRRYALRPSYGRPKLTLISRKKSWLSAMLQITFPPKFWRWGLHIESADFWYIQNFGDSMWRLNFEKLGHNTFWFSENCCGVSPDYCHALTHTSLVWIIYFPQKYTIPQPQKQKNIHFPFSLAKFFCRSAAVSILMPPTFHIASLNRYTSKFSGVPEKHVIHLLKAYASSAVALFDISIWHIDCRYIDTFEK